MRKWSRHNKIVQRSVLSPGHLPWAGTTIWLEALQRHHEVTAVSPPETGPRPAQLGVPPASPAFAQKIRLVSQGQGGCFIFKVPPPRPHAAALTRGGKGVTSYVPSFSETPGDQNGFWSPCPPGSTLITPQSKRGETVNSPLGSFTGGLT